MRALELRPCKVVPASTSETTTDAIHAPIVDFGYFAALRRAGFSSQEAGLLADNLQRFVLALVLLETGGQPSRTAEQQEARTLAFRARLATLPSQDFRYVNEAVDFLYEPSDPEWAFELALNLLIGGLEKLLESSDRPAPRH